MSFGFLGIQFGWGLQMANMSPIYKYLGAEESSLPYLWLAGPLTGLLIQPIVGAMSDRTWTRLGRRRPFFLAGAIIASICLIAMPHSSAVWMAAGLLWIMDASINITMEPFRAFVGDKLPEEQRTLGFVMQSFFIGIGSTLANALPYILTYAGVVGVLKSGIPYSTVIAFTVGAIAFLGAVIWTVYTTDEFPPEDMERFHSEKIQFTGGVGGWFTALFQLARELISEIVTALREMPTTMQQLAIVQFFTWFALPFMWQYYGLTVARNVFGAVDDKSDLFKQGTEWGGICFAVYNFICFLVAFAIPPLASKLGRRGVHMICLTLGGLGLISTYFATNPYFLWIGMAGVGIAWASILSMPYVILAGAIKAERMGVYMGVFNLFIVIPQIFQSFLTPQIYKPLLGDSPLHAVMFGGCSMLLAALCVLFVKDVGAGNIPTSTPGGSVVAGNIAE